MINLQNKKKTTPLLMASQKGSYDVIKYLLDQGANGNMVDDDNDTVLLRVCMSDVSSYKTQQCFEC